MRLASSLVATVAVTTCLAAARDARAQQACDDLPNPVYGLGANALKPLLKNLGKTFSRLEEDPVTIVYQGPGQCFGINGLLDDEVITGTAFYFDAEGTELTCDLPPAGVPIDFAGMNSYPTLCPGVDGIPDDIGDFLGPVQSIDFIVPEASSETSISAEAAYFVYGFGAEGEVAPWTDEAQIFKRDPNSIVLLVAKAIGVPIEKFKGVDAQSNGNTVTLVSTAPDPDAAIGIAAGEVAQANRDVINTLAYQHFGQSCGYWPDSTPTAFDKRNVRDGHYFLWANTHFYTRVDESGEPLHPDVATLVGWLTRTVEPPEGVDVTAIEIASGTVPDCAMEVRRTDDLGDIAIYAPDEPCGCFFDATATGETDCEVCEVDDDCPEGAPNCRHGYCEVN